MSGRCRTHAPDIYWQKWTIDASGNGADGEHTGDINRDGLIDVVSGWEQSGDLMLYLNPGPGALRDTASWSQVDISAGETIEGVEDAAFAVLNLDGFDDAVIAGIEGDTQNLEIHWLGGADLGNPADWRGIKLVPATHAGYMKVRAVQLDGAGGADIIAGTKSMDSLQASIYWFKAPVGSHPANAARWRRFFVGEVDITTVTLVIKDMDADTLPDIVFPGRNGVGWFRNPGVRALGESPGTAVWERIVINDKGSEFTFCDHIVDEREDIIVATSHDSGMVEKSLKRLDASGHGHGVFMMSPRAVIASGMTWDLSNLVPYADYMEYDNLELVDMDTDGDLDVVASEEGEGVFTAGDGVLWFENPLSSPPGAFPDRFLRHAI